MGSKMKDWDKEDEESNEEDENEASEASAGDDSDNSSWIVYSGETRCVKYQIRLCHNATYSIQNNSKSCLSKNLLVNKIELSLFMQGYETKR